MQKSLSTQFAATVFFGPMGLAYTSMPVAVFFTLLLAVLFFTELGILSVLLIWPLSIIIGMLLVKLHNDQHRRHGRLLLAPEDDDGLLVSSGGRALLALCTIALLGTLAIWFAAGKKNVGSDIGRIVDSPATSKTQTAAIDPKPATTKPVLSIAESAAQNQAASQRSKQAVQSSQQSQPVESTSVSKTLPIAKTRPVVRQRVDLSEPATEPVATASSQPSSVVVPIPESSESEGQSVLVPIVSDDLKVIVLDQQQVTPVVIDSSSPSNIKVAVSNFLYVNEPLVNLRGGPGTNNPILAKLTRGEQMTELNREGSWINVTTTDTNITGWIFASLVSDELR